MGTLTMESPTDQHSERVVDHAATATERQYAMMTHLAGLAACIAAVFTMPVTFWMPTAAVVVMWLIRRHDSPFLEDHGREATNFQISLLMFSVGVFCAGFLTCGAAWFIGYPVLAVVSAIGLIRAAVAANRGEYFRYPMCIRVV
jgi:uncharacterized protein